MGDVTVLGIDLAKQVFHAVGMDQRGKVVFKKRIYRGQLESFLNSQPPLLIGIESCSSCHYWARTFQSYGHSVKLIPPQFVKPYVKSNKNDSIDAEAIAEALTRPTMRFVPIKRIEQQDIQSLHRARERLVRGRKALINEVRGLLGEYGIILPQSRQKFRRHVVEQLESEERKLTPMSKELFGILYSEYVSLEERIEVLQLKLDAIAKAHPECQRLMSIPGVGYLSATAVLAAAGDVSVFKNGRQFAAWLGLVPRQYTTGGKPRLGRISKRGNVYLRKLLIHGARATLRYVDSKTDRRSIWAKNLKERTGPNKTAVALANKTARAMWSVLTKAEDYIEFKP